MDFSGKSTLVRHLKQTLKDTHFTREPGGTPAAERIREILLDPQFEMDAWTEAYLYAAARADHVRREILPRLESGEHVLCERYLDSSVAYQGYGRGLRAEAVRELNAFAVGGLIPDATFYLRLGAGERERRARDLGAPLDRLELVGAEFMTRVEEGFEKLIQAEPERIIALDAMLPPENLTRSVLDQMRQLYTRTNERS